MWVYLQIYKGIERGRGETHAREKGVERLISIDAIQCSNKCIGIITQNSVHVPSKTSTTPPTHPRSWKWSAHQHFHPSIHPLSSTCPGPGRGGSRSSRALQASSSPNNTPQLLLGDPKAFPGQNRYIIPPAGSGSASGSPPSQTCPENLQREAPMWHPGQMPEPPQLIPFDVEEQRLYSELPPDV